MISYTEERSLRVFENRILRRILGPNKDVDGEWRRLHNEELHSLCRSPNIFRVIKSRRLKFTDHVGRMEKKVGVLSKFKLVNLHEKRPRGRIKLRWRDDIRMYLKETGANSRKWTVSTQDRDYWKHFEKAELKLQVP